MMRTLTDSTLRAYVVWVPKLGGEEKDVPVATRFMPDDRAKHYWDSGGRLMRSYTRVLSLSEDAWDVYLLYGPEARWDGALPPAPPFWMHQLGPREQSRVPGPYLDPEEFARGVRTLLQSR